MDLGTASREELLNVITQLQQIVAEQQAVIIGLQDRIAHLETRNTELEARNRELEERLGKGGPKGMPGLKPELVTRPKTKKPRKKRPYGFARKRVSEPTERVFHAVDRCPKCDIRVRGGSVKRRREVIEIPIQPVRIVEHVFVERKCPLCRERLVPKDALDGVVVGKRRLGINLMSLIVTLKEEARMPIDTIQWYLQTFHQLQLSEGGIVSAIQGVAKLGEGETKQIRDKIRGSPVVLADETGWRENGQNGYAWTFSTATERYFLRRGRNKEVVDEVLGEEFSGVLVSDFYAAYNHYEGLHQRCWPHLLREIGELKDLHPDNDGLQRWAKAVHKIYKEAKDFHSDDERERLRAKERFERRLLRVCRPFLKDHAALQRKLCWRVHRFIEELFVFVANPEVPADNNGAERSLRHLVTSRKISGGTRSKTGSSAKMTLASLFGTWRAQDLNPFQQCRQLLISPQL